jgi:hypothetical protein
LADTGYVEGRSVMIEYRWAEGRTIFKATIAALDTPEAIDRRLAGAVHRRRRSARYRIGGVLSDSELTLLEKRLLTMAEQSDAKH